VDGTYSLGGFCDVHINSEGIQNAFKAFTKKWPDISIEDLISPVIGRDMTKTELEHQRERSELWQQTREDICSSVIDCPLTERAKILWDSLKPQLKKSA